MKIAPYIGRLLFCLLFITFLCVSVSKAKQRNLLLIDTTQYYSSPYIVKGHFASYPGGDAAFIRYLQANMQPAGKLKVTEDVDSPEKVAEIYVNFQIEKDGTISDVRLTKDVDHQTDVELVRVIKRSVWNPAINNGKPVAGGYSLLVVFVNR